MLALYFAASFASAIPGPGCACFFPDGDRSEPGGAGQRTVPLLYRADRCCGAGPAGPELGAAAHLLRPGLAGVPAGGSNAQRGIGTGRKRGEDPGRGGGKGLLRGRGEKKKRRGFISPPNYYPNNTTHPTPTYCTVATDAMARYKRLTGYEVMFLTGTDEHGQKIEDKAKEAGVTPKEYVDRIVEGAGRAGSVEADEHQQRPVHPHHR